MSVLTQLELRDTGSYRAPLTTSLFRPKAPALKDPRFAGRVIPVALMKHVKGQTWVHEAPSGRYLLFAPKRGSTELVPHLVEDGRPEKLAVGTTWWPCPHAWSTDGERLYLCCRHELWVVTVATREAQLVERVQAGQRFSAVACVGDLVAVESSERFTIWDSSGHERVRERGMQGLVAVVGQGRFLIESSMKRALLYAVRSSDVRLVAMIPNRAVSACWDEADSAWANIDLELDPDFERPAPGIQTSHRTFELRDLDRCYPNEWR